MTVHLAPEVDDPEGLFPCCMQTGFEIATADRVTVDPDLSDCEGLDLGLCAWFQRVIGAPGHDPNGICSFGCVDEPQCQTCIPADGWPCQRGNS